MKEKTYISITHICNNTAIHPDFIQSLVDFGLIQYVQEDPVQNIHTEELPAIERYARLYYDLDINMEGLEVIAHMRDKIIKMQNEMLQLERKLKRFEE